MTRGEAVTKYRKIRFLSEVLQIEHRNKAWINSLGKYDPTGMALESMRLEIEGCRRDLRWVPKLVFSRDVLKDVTEKRVQSQFKTNSDRDRPLSFTIGGTPKARKYKSKYGHNWQYEVKVGWLWKSKVWDNFYTGAYHFAEYFILSADKIRVNSKHIELYEVKAFHRTSGETVNGYVAKTKSPRKTCVFNQRAALAAKQAEVELQAELDLLLKGTSND